VTWGTLGTILIAAGAVVAFIKKEWALGLVAAGLCIAGVAALF
jgi:hypothetical protein